MSNCVIRSYIPGHRGLARECLTHGGGVETAGRDESSREAVRSWEREHRAKVATPAPETKEQQ